MIIRRDPRSGLQQASQTACAHSQSFGLLRPLGFRATVCTRDNPPVQDLGGSLPKVSGMLEDGSGDEHLGLPVSQGGVDDVLELATAFALVAATAVREHPRCQSGRGQRRAHDPRRQENIRGVCHGRHGARRGRTDIPSTEAKMGFPTCCCYRTGELERVRSARLRLPYAFVS